MTKEVTLTRGFVAIVDNEDSDIYSGYKWQYHNGYARLTIQKKGVRQHIYFHREIMKAPKGMVVDHINKDKLDNRRSNLRLCLHSENMRNMKHRCDSRYKYKGTRYNTANKNWNARIRISGREIHLGCFPTEIEAAKAYNAAAIKYHQQYALLNIIQEA